MRDSKARHCLLQLSSKKFSLFASTMLLFFFPPAWEIMMSLVINKDIKESGQPGKGEEQYFFNTSYTCHLENPQNKKTQNQPVILRLVMLSLKFKGTLCKGDSNCTPLLPKYIYVLWWWLVLDPINLFHLHPGALRWWVKNRVDACWKVVYTTWISRGRFCVNFCLCYWTQLKIIISLEG